MTSIRWKRTSDSGKWGCKKVVPSLRKDFEYDNLVAEIRVERGLSQKKLGELIGIGYQTIGRLESGEISPVKYTRSEGVVLKDWVRKLPEVLGCELSELFPREICDIERANYTDEQIAEQFHNGSMVRRKDLLGEINKVLSWLTPREADVIRKRFFEDITLKEISEEYGVSYVLIRMIECKALRKLRHSSVCAGLRECFDESCNPNTG